MARMVDETRRGSEQARGRWLVGLAALWLLHGCAGGPTVADDASVLPRWRAALGGGATVRAQRLDAALMLPDLPADAAVLVVDPNWRLPEGPARAAHLAKLRSYVQRGGRLVLFGHAARLASQLGFEDERPENLVYRWGFDRRAVRGEADLSLHFVSGRVPSLYEGLTGAPTEHSIPITGGAPCNVALCAWRDGAPAQGEVLARLGEMLDGAPAPLGPPVLLRWRHGQGAVLACGLLPDLDHDDGAVRENARGFVARCAAWAGADRGDVVLLELPDRSPALAAAPVDGPPIVPLLSHWGWQASRYDGADEDAARPLQEVVDDVLATSFRHGADVLELTLADVEHGGALAWSAADPIVPPESWRGPKGPAAWPARAYRELAVEAHARGMLLLGGLDALPVGDHAAERMVALRMHARELAEARGLGVGAFDGFGLRQWVDDRRGYGVAMVQDYQPAAALYCAGERAPQVGGGLRALDADDGGVSWLGFSGVAKGWRDGFAGDLFPVGVLDARARPDRFPGAGVRGGGSYGDWLAEQLNDFTRDRLRLGGVALWRRHDPRTLGPRTVDYVHGLSMEPLRAALATPLSATGSDGLRAAAAALLDQPAPGFGASVDAPASTHVLQNNWLRLLGSGGGLQFDPSGAADFGEGAMPLSPGFLHTRLFGGRPKGTELAKDRVELLAGLRRGPGGYSARARVLAGALATRQVPASISCDAAPRWPREVAFEWRAKEGRHELHLGLRAASASSVVAVWLDDVMLQALPVRADVGAVSCTVPVNVARGGLRELRLEVVEGHEVQLERAVISRSGDMGQEARVSIPAGSFAQLLEDSSSSHHAERVTLSMLADVPGFVLRTECLRAERNLQCVRRLDLPTYDRLSAAVPGDDPSRRRGAFVLSSSTLGVPDLCVVPLHLPRYDHFRVEPGAVSWRSALAPGLRAHVGFLFARQGEGHRLMSDLPRMLAAIDQPLYVELGPDGQASLTSDVAVPHARLVHLAVDAQQPVMVCERGFWTWRAVQPAPDGGALLRVHQEPGDVVRIVAGPQVFARTRPGTGALRCVALQQPEASAVTAVVLQPSRLRAPSVVLAADFDEVRVNGRAWSWFDGRTVYLPDEPGTYRVEARRFGALAQPHVRATAAPLQRCAFDPASKQLVLVTEPNASRPAGLPWTAVLHGPVPTSIQNGEVVDIAELSLPDLEAERAAQEGGVLIRFLPGVTRVNYESWNAAPGR